MDKNEIKEKKFESFSILASVDCNFIKFIDQELFCNSFIIPVQDLSDELQTSILENKINKLAIEEELSYKLKRLPTLAIEMIRKIKTKCQNSIVDRSILNPTRIFNILDDCILNFDVK